MSQTQMERVIVHTSEPSSGAARYVTELVEGLTANQAQVTLFCPPTFDHLSRVRSCGASVAFASHRSTEEGGLANRLARNIGFLLGTARRQIAATHRGDVVHVQFPLYFPAGLVFFLIARAKRCPIVFTAHDPLPHKWLLPPRFRSFEREMLRWAYSLSSRIIVHNEAGRDVLIKKFGISPARIAVIPHGPLKAPQPIQPMPEGALRLLFFGSIRENKCLHLAIEAVQRMNERRAEAIHLTIAGEVANAREQDYWNSCERLIERDPRGIHVINRYIEDCEVGPLVADHHALLLPYSGFTSESGVAALALGNARPIISTGEGGLGALLDAGCGIRIEESTAAGVIEAIEKATAAGSAGLQRLGERGAALMSADRSWVEIGRRTLGVYRETRGALSTPVSSATPRILMLITTLTFGGAETQVIRLAIELKRRGWLVKVACMVDPNAYVDQLQAENIEVLSLGMPRGLPDPRAIWRLRKIINSFQPNVVHAHMVHANLLGRIARLFCRMPALICTAHNLQERSEKGGATWHKELLYRCTDPLADRTTIICKAAFDRYVRVGAVPSRKLQLIPNGIDTQRFSPSPEARARVRASLGLGASFVWLAVGRLVEQKNYPGLFQALRLLPDGDWTVMIAGNGPLSGQLEAECNRAGVADRVRFLGAGRNMWELYNAADAFVMSSRYEGLSIALLEAASMSLPSVVTDVGGNAEVVLHGVSGYVVTPDSPSQLSNAMQSLQGASPASRQAFGLAAREHCEKTFCFETVTEQWLKLYNQYAVGLPSQLVATGECAL